MTFRHDASAAAVGGYFTLPFTEPLEVQASSVLAPVGGYGSARVEGFRFQEIVSFDAGYSQVSGIQHQVDGTTVHETLVSAVVEGLNILDMITADRVVARLASEYPAGTPSDELSFLPVGSYFVNLRIAGVLVGDAGGELHPRPDLLAVDDRQQATMSFIQRTCVERKGIQDAGGKPVSAFHDGPGKPRPPLRDADGKPISGPQKRLRLPLFDLSGYEIPGATTQAGEGCRIEVPNFGAIILGEFVVSPAERRLTMIIVELHSPDKGELAVGPIRGNGSPA